MKQKYDFFIKLAFECFREDAEKDSQKAMLFVECLSDAPIYIREKYRDFITQRVFDDDFANALAGDMYDAPNLLAALYLEFATEIERGIDQATVFEDYEEYCKLWRSVNSSEQMLFL